MKSVLLTDGLLRKTVAAARSLGARGVPVHVAETTRFNPAAFSRYCDKGYVCPSPNEDGEGFARWLAERMARSGIDLLFPMDDGAMQAAQFHRDLFHPSALAALPPAESYRIAADKVATVRLAEQSGVPVPQTAFPAHPDEVLKLARDFAGPVLIKPRFSSGSRGIRVAERMEELDAAYREVHADYPLPMLQAFIPTGERYDVCLLYDRDGRLKASFVQKELRHFPLERGPSTLQESVHRPDLVELALALMERLPWTGVVEVEFMIDPRDQTPVLMEINPRFWNSVQTAILSGIDFPWLLYQIACGGTTDFMFTYKSGVRCRSLLPGDVLHYAANPDRFRMEPGFWRRPPEGGRDDLLSWRDPGPVIGFLLASFRFLFDRGRWKQLFDR